MEVEISINSVAIILTAIILKGRTWELSLVGCFKSWQNPQGFGCLCRDLSEEAGKAQNLRKPAIPEYCENSQEI